MAPQPNFRRLLGSIREMELTHQRDATRAKFLSA
jgi:hypothetical protein